MIGCIVRGEGQQDGLSLDSNTHNTPELDMRSGIAGGCKTVGAVADSAKLPAAGVPPRKHTSEKICIRECFRRKLQVAY
jgi:hypothetical protein